MISHTGKCMIYLAILILRVTTTRYEGFTVLRIEAGSQQAVRSLESLKRQGNLDFWTGPRLGINDVMVKQRAVAQITRWLRKHQMDFTTMISDVQGLIDTTDESVPLLRAQNRSPLYNMTWEKYHRLAEIQGFAAALASAYPDKVKVSSAGKSVQGRNLTLIKLSTGGTKKNAIFIDGGIHAREWISPATVTWLVRELVENHNDHPEFLTNLDWYIIPVVNPDGYEYTFTKDRLWRKNRNRTIRFRCTGVDLNRNFGFHWNEGGSSNYACHDAYHGPNAFSEPESKALRNTLLSIANQTKVYLTFHSYGQYWLYPWGYTKELPVDYPALESLALDATRALAAVYGTNYTVGSSTNVLDIASGGSDDWAKGGAGIPYSYTVELRDTETHGFLLPPNQIIPNCLEIWEAIKVVAKKAMKL